MNINRSVLTIVLLFCSFAVSANTQVNGRTETIKVEGTCKRAVDAKKRYFSYLLTFDVIRTIVGDLSGQEISVEVKPQPWAKKDSVEANLVELLKVRRVKDEPQTEYACDSAIPVVLTLERRLSDEGTVLDTELTEFGTADSRKGVVSVGRHIAFQISTTYIDPVPGSVKVSADPEGMIEASFDGTSWLRVKGLREGSGTVMITGIRYLRDPNFASTGKTEPYREIIDITVLPARPLSYMPPKTVRDYFMLLPEKYFTRESCKWETDMDCEEAGLEYLKRYGEIDTKNGYIKGGCDGAQSCMEMAIFRRPDGSHLVGLAVSQEMMSNFYFLNYKDGEWTEVSQSVVPRFSKNNYYEFPRYGTTVKVYSKRTLEKGDDWEISEKGPRLYDLEWKTGRFVVVQPRPGKRK